MTTLTTEQSLQVAMQHHGAGRIEQAERLYREVLSEQPDNAGALNCLGVLAVQSGRPGAAVDLLERAIRNNPGAASYHCNLGEALRHLGRIDDAIFSYRRAIRLQPGLAVAHNNLGIALAERNDLPRAIKSYQKAIELAPTYAEAHANLGGALARLGQSREAIEACERAIVLQPDNGVGYNNLGVVLAEKCSYPAAITAYRKAIELKPNYAEAYSNLGNSLAGLGEFAKATRACQSAARIAPTSVAAHWNLAVALLRAGQFEQGWEEYEWRWASCKQAGAKRFEQACWNGQPLEGKRILLHAEQGLGDVIQFSRYAPLVAARDARVMLQCPAELHELLKTLSGIDQTIEAGSLLPTFDFHCPLMSLPRALGTRIDSIPAATPYLSASPRDVEAWNSLFSKKAGRFNVGLCWAGKPTHNNDRNRSIDPSLLAPLAHCGATFFSLAKGRGTRDVPRELDLIDETNRLADFAQTAGLIANLDLVITVDTAVAHLAGALGKETWVLLPCLPDWRWLTHRSDSPWYPTMRLFRQPSPGNWAAVMEDVCRALKSRAQ